jgi:hypothetical protein
MKKLSQVRTITCGPVMKNSDGYFCTIVLKGYLNLLKKIGLSFSFILFFQRHKINIKICSTGVVI